MAQSTQPRAATLQYVGRLIAYRFGIDRVTDLAAAMTYYLMLSVFPLLLAVVSIVSLVGGANWLMPAISDAISSVASPEAAKTFDGIVSGFLAGEGAGLTLVISLVAAIWSASNYIGAFARAVNTVYQVREGRSFIKLKAVQLVMTLALVLAIILLGVALAVSSPAAEWLGNLFGLGAQFAAVWGWLRYLLIAVVVIILVQLLYFVAPNVRHPHIRVLSVGSAVAIALAVLVVEVFKVYLSVFNGASSYAKTYGALAGVIIALFLTFLVNVALILGAELDAALERLHQLKLGLPAQSGLVLPPRDEKGIKALRNTRTKLVERGQNIRADAAQPDENAIAWYQEHALHQERDQSLD